MCFIQLLFNYLCFYVFTFFQYFLKLILFFYLLTCYEILKTPKKFNLNEVLYGNHYFLTILLDNQRVVFLFGLIGFVYQYQPGYKIILHQIKSTITFCSIFSVKATSCQYSNLHFCAKFKALQTASPIQFQIKRKSEVNNNNNKTLF